MIQCYYKKQKNILKTPKQIYPVVLITWEDILGQDGGWIKPGHSDVVPCLVTSVGYLVLDTDQYLVYASDLAHDGETNGRTQVPKANIKSIKVLKKVPAKRIRAKKVVLSEGTET